MGFPGMLSGSVAEMQETGRGVALHAIPLRSTLSCTVITTTLYLAVVFVDFRPVEIRYTLLDCIPMPDRHTSPVGNSGSLEDALNDFADEIDAWIGRVIRAYPTGFTSDSHDGGTFMTCWVPHIRAARDQRAAEFMYRYRYEAKRHFEETDQWLDGYWRRQEVHHGTEHFDIFLRATDKLPLGDDVTARQVEDAAEHIGNWKPGFPEWFDWDTGLFRSFYLGTEHVGEPSCNVPDHVRLAGLALLAHDLSGRERYLELARRHCTRWAAALNSGDQLPAGIDADGSIYGLGDEDKESYDSFAGAAPDDLGADLPRAENLLASGVPDTLLTLWEKSGDGVFRSAAERIIDVAVEVLNSPIAWQAHAAVRRYRQTTGSDRYDDLVKAVGDESLRPVRELTIVPEVEQPVVTGPLGMRSDKPDWLDQDGKPAPSPLLMALRALVTGEENLLIRALDLGRAHFQLAREVFGDVTHHGCGSRSLSAVCRGHGRLNGAGVVTEVLAPAIEVYLAE